MMRRQGVNFIVARPVHAAAMRLLVLHCIYRGPERRKQGRVVTCSLRVDPLDEASAWLHRHLEFWNGRLDALDRYLAQQKKKENDG